MKTRCGEGRSVGFFCDSSVFAVRSKTTVGAATAVAATDNRIIAMTNTFLI